MTPLMLFTLAWAAGICLAQGAGASPVWFALSLPLALVLLIGWGDRRDARQAAIMLLGASLGAARLIAAQPRITPAHVAAHLGQRQVTVEGVVMAEPDRSLDRARLRVRVESLALGDGDPWHAEGLLLVYVPAHADIDYGDRIVALGDLKAPAAYGDFSYREYLARQGVYATLTPVAIDVTATNQANPFLAVLIRFKEHAYGVIQSLLPEPEGSLLAGILLGIERDMPPDVVDAFEASGTSHIVAVSGFNLTLAAGLVARLARRALRRRGETVLALTVVWIYVLLVGASAAVVRAGVMASLLFIGERLGRRVHGPTSLAATILLLSIWNPFVLWDIGFQLSVAAMWGLMCYVGPLSAWLEAQLERLTTHERAERVVAALSDVLIVTVAVQLTTLPVQVAHFHTISPIAPVANLFILPAQPFVMAFGALALGAGLVWRALGTLVAYVAWVFLSYSIAIANLAARVPQIPLELGRLTSLVVAGYYVLLLTVTWLCGRSAAERQGLLDRLRAINRWVAATGVAILVLLITWVAATPDGKLHVAFLDVGVGDAVFVRTPSGRQILVNGGEDTRRTLAEIGRHLPFWDRQLDLVLLTSPDEARVTGLSALLERYEVDAIAVSPEVGDGPSYSRWTVLLADRPPGIVSQLIEGAVWDFGDGVSLRALSPPAGQSVPVVLQLQYRDISVLLMGDTTTRAEEALVARYGAALQSQVLQLGRYGHRASSSAALLQAVTPEYAVIGYWPNTDLELLKARLMTVPLYETQLRGTVRLTSDGETVDIRTAN